MPLARFDIVQSIINRKQATDYLEIGVSWGHSFFPIRAKRKIGVDPKNLLSKSNLIGFGERGLKKQKLANDLLNILGVQKTYFFEMTSDDFFSQSAKKVFSKKKADIVFIDGLHTYEQAYRDVLNSLTHLEPNGVILMHDCNPEDKKMETPAASIEEAVQKNSPDWDGRWCGDVWKSIVHLRSNFKDLNVFVLDCDMGIGAITRGEMTDPLSFTKEQIQQMSYDDLERNRQKLLNLKKESYFHDFLKSL